MFVSCLFLVLFASVGFSEPQSEVRDRGDYNYDETYDDYDSDYSNEEYTPDEGRKVVINFLKYLLGLATKHQKSLPPARRPRPGKLLPSARPGKIPSRDDSRYRAEEDPAEMRKRILEQLDAAHKIYARLEEHASGK